MKVGWPATAMVAAAPFLSAACPVIRATEQAPSARDMIASQAVHRPLPSTQTAFGAGMDVPV